MAEGELVKVHFDDMYEAAQFASDTKKRLETLKDQVLRELTVSWEGLAGDTFANERTKFLNAWTHIEHALGGLADLINNQIATDLAGADGSEAGVLDGVGTIKGGMASSSFGYVASGLNNS